MEYFSPKRAAKLCLGTTHKRSARNATYNGRFTEDLTALQRLIRNGDGDKLFELFTRTRAIRRGIISAGQETAAPDFGRPHEKGEPPKG